MVAATMRENHTWNARVNFLFVRAKIKSIFVKFIGACIWLRLKTYRENGAHARPRARVCVWLDSCVWKLENWNQMKNNNNNIRMSRVEHILACVWNGVRNDGAHGAKRSFSCDTVQYRERNVRIAWPPCVERTSHTHTDTGRHSHAIIKFIN